MKNCDFLCIEIILFIYLKVTNRKLILIRAK